MTLHNYLPVVIEFNSQKEAGFLMKLTTVGALVELDKFIFKIGDYVLLSFSLEGGAVITEKVRSIKHYDHFFRVAPKKKLAPGEVAPAAKKLCEFHFHLLSEAHKVAITKYLISQSKKINKRS